MLYHVPDVLSHTFYLVALKDGLVFAVEFSHRSGRDLLNVAKKRPNIIPIIEDARHPHKYRMVVGKLAFLPNSVNGKRKHAFVANSCHVLIWPKWFLILMMFM